MYKFYETKPKIFAKITFWNIFFCFLGAQKSDAASTVAVKAWKNIYETWKLQKNKINYELFFFLKA